MNTKIIEIIPYIILLMTFWDFSVHIIDKRDRKYRIRNEYHKTWHKKIIGSSSYISYYYPHFWGKKPVSEEQAWKRYDYFWLAYWGAASTLLLIYIIFR